MLNSLKHNFGPLTNLLDNKKGEIFEQLYSEGAITEMHKEYIVAGDTDKDKNSRLLNVLKRRSADDFSKFLACLTSHQPELVKVLQRGGDEAADCYDR